MPWGHGDSQRSTVAKEQHWKMASQLTGGSAVLQHPRMRLRIAVALLLGLASVIAPGPSSAEPIISYSYTHFRDGRSVIETTTTDAVEFSETRVELDLGSRDAMHPDWSPDGTALAFTMETRSVATPGTSVGTLPRRTMSTSRCPDRALIRRVALCSRARCGFAPRAPRRDARSACSPRSRSPM